MQQGDPPSSEAPPNLQAERSLPTINPTPSHLLTTTHQNIVTFYLALRIEVCCSCRHFSPQHCIATSSPTFAHLANFKFPFATRRHDSLHPTCPPRWSVVPPHVCNIVERVLIEPPGLILCGSVDDEQVQWHPEHLSASDALRTAC